MERRRKITELRLLVLLIASCFALQIHASSEIEKQKAEDAAGDLFSSFQPRMTISTGDQHELPYKLYDVSFDNDQIHTLVTHSAPKVESWLSIINPIIHENPIIGLDVEWRPNLKYQQNRIATLQLCVGHHCLIYQLIHTQNIPRSLFDFLANRSYKFVGVDIEKDVEKLSQDYALKVTNAVDLGVLAAKRRGRSELQNFSLKRLAREVLEKEMGKPEEVVRSCWDSEWLTSRQVEYACLDAFVSSEIGRRLNAAA